MLNVTMDDLACYGDFIIHVHNHVLVAGLFDKSRVKARALGCKFGYQVLNVGSLKYATRDSKYHVDYAKMNLCRGRDNFYYVLATNVDVGSKYLITTSEHLYNDLYDVLMTQFKLPLLKQWMPILLDEAIRTRYVSHPDYCIRANDYNQTFFLHGQNVKLRDLLVYDLYALDDEHLKSLVSTLLRDKKIWITKEEIPPLKFDSFNDYIAKYGSSLVENIEREISPLIELKGTVDGLALKHKRLFPQQAACANGINALRRHKIKYGLGIEGMGCGKTIQGAAVVESYFIEKWLRQHPGKTLVDAYQDNVIHYRSIIMCPGHLVEKWKSEIEKEIPYAKGIILNDFNQLLELRNLGPKRNGKIFYIISKDFCKLDSQYSPIPTMVRRKYPAVPICVDCYDMNNRIVYKNGRGKSSVCSQCGGKHFKAYPLTHYGLQEGLIYPLDIILMFLRILSLAFKEKSGQET